MKNKESYKLKYHTKKKKYGRDRFSRYRSLLNKNKNKNKMKGGVFGRASIAIEVNSPFFQLPKLKEGVSFGDKSKKGVPLLPPYMTRGDFTKFMSSFHKFYKEYNKAFKNVEGALLYDKIKKMVDSGDVIKPSYLNNISVITSSTLPISDKSLLTQIEMLLMDMDADKVKNLLAQYESLLNPITRIDPNTGEVNTFYNATNISQEEKKIQEEEEKKAEEENQKLKKKLRDHLYKYHKTRLQIKHVYDNIKKQADVFKSVISNIKDSIASGIYKQEDIEQLLKTEQQTEKDKKKNHSNQIKDFVSRIPKIKDELKKQGADDQTIQGIINYSLDNMKSEKIDSERVDKLLSMIDILFEKVKSIDYSKEGPYTYPEAMSLLIQDPEKFFKDYPKFFDKSQGKIVSHLLRKNLPWLMEIGIANDFFITKGLGDALTNLRRNDYLNNDNADPVLQNFRNTGILSEQNLEYLTDLFNPTELLNKKGYTKTVENKKSTRDFASILDHQFERPAQLERRSQEAKEKSRVRFINEVNPTKGVVTLVGETAPLNQGIKTALTRTGSLMLTKSSTGRSGPKLSTHGHIQEHQNARLLKILLRLGPLISENPEDLITTLLPNVEREKGVITSQKALDHVRQLFPDEEDYQNFLTYGHHPIDSLLIDLLIIQSLYPEGHDDYKKEKKASLLKTFISNIKGKVLKMLSRSKKKPKFDPEKIFSNNNDLEEDLENLEEILENLESETESERNNSSTESITISSTTSSSNLTSNSTSTSTNNNNNNNSIDPIFYDSVSTQSSPPSSINTNHVNKKEEEFDAALKILTPQLENLRREVWV